MCIRDSIYLVHALIIYHKALIIRVKLYAVKSKLLYVGYLLLIGLSLRIIYRQGSSFAESLSFYPSIAILSQNYNPPAA